uniref:Secreted protein n=1 Tax=Angiostrongylus cantonensis TaxID=6313 RepID=A0A0K0DIB7_ANGCA
MNLLLFIFNEMQTAATLFPILGLFILRSYVLSADAVPSHVDTDEDVCRISRFEIFSEGKGEEMSKFLCALFVHHSDGGCHNCLKWDMQQQEEPNKHWGKQLRLVGRLGFSLASLLKLREIGRNPLTTSPVQTICFNLQPTASAYEDGHLPYAT